MNILFRSLIKVTYFGLLLLIRHYSGFEYAVLAGITIAISYQFDIEKISKQ